MRRDFPHLSMSKRRKVLLRLVKKAVKMFNLFEKNDRVIIAISGGIDSLAMFDILTDKSAWWSRLLEFIPVHIDTGFPREDNSLEILGDYIEKNGYELRIVDKREIARTALGDGKPQNPCFICSRMRRKALLEIAEEVGANKIAMAHHREDVLETLLINLFWGREIAAFMPNQPLFSGKYHIIRPMFLVKESQLKGYAKLRVIPDLSAKCPVAGNTKREYIKELLNRLERENSGLKRNMFRALFHPKTEYLLGEYTKTPK